MPGTNASKHFKACLEIKNNTMPESTDWIHSIRPQLLELLNKMRHPRIKGFYSYSLSGDIFDPLTTRWGVGNTVFAAKTYYMLNAMELANHEEMSAFIKSFQTESGDIYDPLIEKRSSLRRLMSSFRGLNFDNISNRQTRTAETRQEFAAVLSIVSLPDRSFKQICYEKKSIAESIN